MSTGTSFAVATTAGVAALWLSYHQNDPRLEALRNRHQLVKAFRSLLRATARVPPQSVNEDGTKLSWDAREFGPGIVDARALLNAPLPDPTDVAEEAGEDSPCAATLDGIRSVFLGAPNRDGRIRILLNSKDEHLCDVASISTELAHLYAVNGLAARAIDVLRQPDEPSKSMYAESRAGLVTLELSRSLKKALLLQ